MRGGWWVGLWVVALGTCHGAEVQRVADLAAPDSGVRIQLEGVHRTGSVEHAADRVAQQRYTFAPAMKPQIILAPENDVWDWSTQGELHLRVQDAMAWPVTLDVAVKDATGNELQARVGVWPGPPQTLVV
ncbi:MAG: beta-agarase, partial [Rhodanobacter sp.]